MEGTLHYEKWGELSQNYALTIGDILTLEHGQSIRHF
jgi:hypothetical protein